MINHLKPSCKMFFLFLNHVLILVIFFTIPSASQPQEASQLLRFRNSLPETSRILLQWNQTSSVSAHCQWPGVSCYSSQDFRVRSLNLTSFRLSGVLENSISNLCLLTHLIKLDLSGNNFTGNIPLQLGNCSRVNTVLLHDNGLTGPIPPEIFKPAILQQLNLGFNRISGMIPAEVSHCSSLEYLGLYNNHLSGEIPSELFALPNLNAVYLGTNNLTGILPDLPSPCLLSDLQIHENSFHGSLPLSLSNCHDLRELHASDNSLDGTIPPNFFEGLSQLEVLHLSMNNFEGEIPESLWDLQNLRELGLHSNRFNGTIPGDMSRCQALTNVYLFSNSLTGQIPSSVGSLRKLEFLYLFNNKFSGVLPPEIGNLTSIVELGLHLNQIGGIIPREICALQSLKHLQLFKNLFEGPIPHCIGNLTSLHHLGLYENNLVGRIPFGISNLTNLAYLSLAHNNLTGKVPPDLGRNMPRLHRLDLTGNSFFGEIPSGMCSGNSLRVLTLGDNLFTGSFPAEIVKCLLLYRLILSHNLLQGSIPMENSSSISHFDIRGNLVEGTIPSVLGFWSNLSMIDLSENNFSGSIPQELGNLQNLEELRISSNRLTGRIPPELARCPKITELNLSGNQLSGGIPSEIISSSTLQVIELQDNRLNGVIPDSFTSGQSLRELQLGNNLLEGTFPCSLSEVQHLSSLLNLSMNRLSGQIPKCLGQLDRLEILDISSNNFSGEIPSDTNNMASLSFLNISFNQLSGQIPATWAKLLELHPGNTLGNPGLCLTTTTNRNCGSHQKSHSTGFILAGIITVSLFLMACLLASIYVLQKRIWCPPPSSPYQSLLYSRSGSEDLPEDLSFEDIVHGTEGWNDNYVIGRGKHGTVYRIESVKSRKFWAVKKADQSNAKFSNEVRTLNLVRHRNVLRMGGYSIRKGFGIIVTEYMPAGTLYDLLHRRSPRVVLNWETRHRIALGIAQGLSYLHHDCLPPIIHRDIKSDNILLDSELEPKIGDFGSAKLDSDGDESPKTSTIVGTLGYIAPENAYSTKLTDKCDVYSYGVILLELLCRKLPVDSSFDEGLDIVSWVRKVVQDYNGCFCCLDEEIKQWDDEDQQEAMVMMNLALQCTEMAPDIRPSMRDVVGSLLKLNSRRKSRV